MIGNTELALDDVPHGNPARANLEEIRTAGLRAADIVQQLLKFSRHTDGDLKPVSAVSLLENALVLLQSSATSSIQIRKHMPDTDVTIRADSIQIHQAMMNICTNAFQAIQETGGILDITMEEVWLPWTANWAQAPLSR